MRWCGETATPCSRPLISGRPRPDEPASHKEVLSMNEELQSTNEELTTLNAQRQDKVHELTSVNDDLANLLVSTDIATVLLDTDLRIKRFTTAASHVLNLQKSDTGRPMQHVASNLANVDLARDARAVLSTMIPVEKEVGPEDGRQYFLRVLPYRAAEQAVQGVVLTLDDVTTPMICESPLRSRPSVSVVLPMFNEEENIGHALEMAAEA